MALFNYECDEIKRIIEEVSPNYPQLTTFEKEWLYFHKYGYIPGIPVELECETVSVSPYGSVLNAIPYRYKSAILKGNTLVNLCNASNRSETLTSSSRIFYCKIPYTIKANSGFTFFAKISNSTTSGQINLQCAHPDGTYSYPKIMDASTNGVVNLHIINAKDITNILIYISNTDTGQVTVSDVMIIEGDYANVNVPYFEGMQSVKMPVLTTSNEDGTKTNILTTNEEVVLRGVGDVKDELNLLTGELTQRINEIVLNGSEEWTLYEHNMPSVIGFYTSVALPNVLPGLSDSQRRIVLSDTFIFKNQPLTNDEEFIFISNAGKLNLNIKRSKLSAIDLTSFKSYLASNPLTIQYQLETESVKTDDLTTLNKPYEGVNNYYLTANIPCEAVLEVPVVSTGKQTLQEINE